MPVSITTHAGGQGANPAAETFWTEMLAIVALTNVSEANIIELTAAVSAIQSLLALLGHRMDAVEAAQASMQSQINNLAAQIGGGPVFVPRTGPVSAPTGPAIDTSSSGSLTPPPITFAPFTLAPATPTGSTGGTIPSGGSPGTTSPIGPSGGGGDTGGNTGAELILPD